MTPYRKAKSKPPAMPPAPIYMTPACALRAELEIVGAEYLALE